MTQNGKNTQEIMEELKRKRQKLVRKNQKNLDGVQQLINNQQRSQACAHPTQQYNNHTYGKSSHPTTPHFPDEPKKEKHRSEARSSCRGG